MSSRICSLTWPHCLSLSCYFNTLCQNPDKVRLDVVRWRSSSACRHQPPERDRRREQLAALQSATSAPLRISAGEPASSADFPEKDTWQGSVDYPRATVPGDQGSARFPKRPFFGSVRDGSAPRSIQAEDGRGQPKISRVWVWDPIEGASSCPMRGYDLLPFDERECGIARQLFGLVNRFGRRHARAPACGHSPVQPPTRVCPAPRPSVARPRRRRARSARRVRRQPYVAAGRTGR